MIDFEEFKNSLKINKNDLDSEIVRQPELYFKVAEAYAIAVSVRDASKEAVKQLEAEKGLEIREALDNSGVRATESLVTSHLNCDEEYKQARSKYLENSALVEKLDALKSAYTSRGFMLRDLVQLYVSEYFLNNSASYSAPSRNIQEDYEALKAKIASARKARKKKDD